MDLNDLDMIDLYAEKTAVTATHFAALFMRRPRYGNVSVGYATSCAAAQASDLWWEVDGS